MHSTPSGSPSRAATLPQRAESPGATSSVATSPAPADSPQHHRQQQQHQQHDPAAGHSTLTPRPSIDLGSDRGDASASSSSIHQEAVVASERQNAMKEQLRALHDQIMERSQRLEELLVVQAAVNAQSNQLRRKQLALDPMRHTVQRLQGECKKLEHDLGKINEQLAGPESRQAELQVKQARAEEAYVDRFELRPHRLSDRAMISLGGLAKSDLAEFEAERRRDEVLKKQAQQRKREQQERDRRRRFEEDDEDASGLEDLLTRCGKYNNTSGASAQLQDLYGGPKQTSSLAAADSASSQRRLPPTSVVPAWFQPPKKTTFDAKKWTDKHFHVPAKDPQAKLSPRRLVGENKKNPKDNDSADAFRCRDDDSVVTLYSNDSVTNKQCTRKTRFIRNRFIAEVWEKSLQK